eukprot:scaffold31510_cov73-Phaeocystis_antarctica.AAC.1
MSTRRIRLLPPSCDASCDNTLNEEEPKDGVECGVAGTISGKNTVCVQPHIACAPSAEWRVAGSPKSDAASLSQRHAHRDERITAARLDRDAMR